MKKVLVFIMIAAVFALAVIQDRSYAVSKTLRVQGVENVVSAQLFPAHAGASSTALELDIRSAKDREVIGKLLTLLDSSKVVGDAKNQFISNGGSPTQLRIKFKSGEEIGIVDAVGSVSRKLDNGSIEVHSESIHNQVTIYQNDKARRVVVPELKAWIEDGWSQEEAFKFTPEEAIANVLKEHPGFPAQAKETKTNFEQIGGPVNHLQEVTLTTTVEKSDQVSYIVTLTKDYNLKISGKDAINFWKYRTSKNDVTLIDKQDVIPTIR